MRFLSRIWRCKLYGSLIVAMILTFSVLTSADDAEMPLLLQLKNSFNDPSGLLRSWNTQNPDHCSWFGITCSRESMVFSINITIRDSIGAENSFSSACSLFDSSLYLGTGFGRNCGGNERLKGILSPLLGNFLELRALSLPFHDLTGDIPREIWELGKLEFLNLEGNKLSGSLPVQFGGLGNLKVLNLAFNVMEGTIPDSLLNCGQLEVLNLVGNRFGGILPTFLGNLSNLHEIYLSFNRFRGSFPVSLTYDCRLLEHLDLSGNFLSGAIPGSLRNCARLRSLRLFANAFDDVIPRGLGMLKRLQVLDLSRNSLSGAVPAELGNCRELSVLVLSNMFDPLSDDSSSRGPLDLVSDDYNYFQGSIPESITTIPKLTVLWAPRATLEGQIPSNWGVCENLEMVNLGYNYFTGPIPRAFGRCKNLRHLNLSSNRLDGSLSDQLPVPCMTLFDVSGNLLHGLLPDFIQQKCPMLSSVDTLATPFRDLSTCYQVFFTYMSVSGVSLPNFGISGSLPVLHNFGANNFSGSLKQLPVVTDRSENTRYTILINENDFAGLLPGSFFAKCKGMNGFFANISNNKLSGQVAMDIAKNCKSMILLDISRNQFTGRIPDNFGDMYSLVSLDMSGNMLSGQIPPIFGKLSHLKHLCLAENNLTGVIPPGLMELPSLETLKLSSNSLSGEIPQDVAKLTNLSVLLLDHNRFSGRIPPDFSNLTSFSLFNVSFNNLSGRIPFYADSVACSRVIGNPLFTSCRMEPLSVPSSDLHGQHGMSQQTADAPAVSTSEKNKIGGLSSIEIASITSAAAIFSVLVGLIILFSYTRKCVPSSSVQAMGRKEVTLFRDIGVSLTYDVVMRATGGFSSSNCIGTGGFGATYKAEISPGILVAVKRLSVGRFQGDQQFQAEIKTLGRMRHPNLVTLIGFHASESEMFLIYNFLPGGNLENFINERSKRQVDWKMLHKIALDVARALAYLHDQCVPRVLHRDVKPSNILLDNEFNAYLSDFGLARLLGTSETHATTGVAGTFGYVAPEYAMTCRVCDKADVYSYGVVLLELISDKKALDPSFSSYGNGFNIVAWACMLLRQGRSREVFTTGLWNVGPHDDLVEILRLAVLCTVDSFSIRPTMKQVVHRLKQLQPPPS